MTRKQIFYSGNVQGVGFRYTALRAGRNYEVTGYVRNLADGRVEMVAEGLSGEIEKLKSDIATALGSYIKQVDEGDSACTGEFNGFEIRF